MKVTPFLEKTGLGYEAIPVDTRKVGKPCMTA